MHLELAVGVGAQQRTDQQHGRAGGAHPARQHRADGQQQGVDHGRAHQRTGQAYATGHGEQGEQQDDERNVFQQQGVQHFVQGQRGTELEGEGHQEGQPPEGGDLAEVMVPEMRRHQGKNGNGQQHAGKRHRPQAAEQRTVEMRRARTGGERHAREHGGNGGHEGHGRLLDLGLHWGASLASLCMESVRPGHGDRDVVDRDDSLSWHVPFVLVGVSGRSMVRPRHAARRTADRCQRL